MHVVATAGHVDHGKSTLIRALTGSDPDRLVEEQRRGLSIRLGYCWTRIEPVGDVAFVDVPGHERFVATALSGLGPVPTVMFVVAADDPWMPQAAEHLAAIDALEISHGLLVVTRADLADPAQALARARAELNRTSLGEVPAVVVSGTTGAGIGRLRAVLAALLRTLPAANPDAPVRLWLDRRFHIRGSGTVVTGTLSEGTIQVGDRLCLPDGDSVRVRSLQSLDTPVDHVAGTARVALGLGGRAPQSLRHDSVLSTPGAFAPTRRVDVRVSGESLPPERPLLHLGAWSGSVHARMLGQRFARLTLSEALPLRYADRAVLRDPGSRQVWGLQMLDVDPPAFHRRGDAARRSERLAMGEVGLTVAAVPPPATPARAADPDPADLDLFDRLRAELLAAPFCPPDAELLARLGLDDGALVRLSRTDRLVRLAPGIAVLPETPAQALSILRGLPQPFTASQARQALGTSRRVALPLLAHLDRSGALLHLPDDRRRVR